MSPYFDESIEDSLCNGGVCRLACVFCFWSAVARLENTDAENEEPGPRLVHASMALHHKADLDHRLFYVGFVVGWVEQF